jgi:hypothetical protein
MLNTMKIAVGARPPDPAAVTLHRTWHEENRMSLLATELSVTTPWAPKPLRVHAVGTPPAGTGGLRRIRWLSPPTPGQLHHAVAEAS